MRAFFESIRSAFRKKWLRWLTFFLFLLFYSWAYAFLGGVLILEANTERTGNLQEAYINAVYEADAYSKGRLDSEESISYRFTQKLPQYTDGTIDPLWPWLMRSYADESPDVLFERGKWANLILSGTLLVLLGVAAAQSFSFTGAAAVILMGGFGVILERSTYFSADALFYLLILLVWVCSLSLIRQNGLYLYGVFGLLLGLAYLAKPLVWPIILAFLIVSFIRSITPRREIDPEREKEDLWVPSNQLVGIAMTVTAFIIMTGPRLSFAGEEFGNPFHSWQKYTVWFDSPRESSQFQRVHSDRESLTALTIAEKPGPIRYLKDHSVLEMMNRAWTGALEQVKMSVLGRGGWILFYSFVVFLVIGGIHRWALLRQAGEVWRVRGTSARWMLLFLSITVILTLFHTGIGNDLVPNNTMTTALFLPVLVTFIWIAERYRRQLQRSHQAQLANWVHRGLMIGPILWIGFRIISALQMPVT